MIALPDSVQRLATILFAVAILHTFLSSRLRQLSHLFPDGSLLENLFHLLGEVEIVFGLWAGLFIGASAVLIGPGPIIEYAKVLHFTEPLFVFAIMTVASSRPVIEFAAAAIGGVAKLLPLPRPTAHYAACLTVGPLLGSFITEPAAMTVTALILLDRFFRLKTSTRFKYITLATLFVNVSMGGVLTPYSAPPVLMVARKWELTLPLMLQLFGWKAIAATLLNAFWAGFVLRKELAALTLRERDAPPSRVPAWITILHLLFLACMVATARHAVVFVGLLCFFIGVTRVTRKFQTELKIRESLLVAFFLGGLVVLGQPQAWWLKPLMERLDGIQLFLGTSFLTAFLDNAALTFLGSQVPAVSAQFKYALLSGAIAGGGLTVIANAPNPAGYAILEEAFGPDGISPLKLLVAALIPTWIGMLVLGFSLAYSTK